MLFDHIIPSVFNFFKFGSPLPSLDDEDAKEDLAITFLNFKEEAEDIDDSIWELKCPESIDCVFIMATCKDTTCIRLQRLNTKNKRLFLEINSEPEVLPVTLVLIGLQTVRKGNQHYYIVRAEGISEITSELSTLELNLVESTGAICGSKLMDLANNTNGAKIKVQHRIGSKYWIMTEPRNEKDISKIIVLQNDDTKDMFFFFTENTYKFKSLPFALKPCFKYRCMTLYGTTYHSDDLPLSFKCRSTHLADFNQNYHLQLTSELHTFIAYMTKSELQILWNKSSKYANRTPNHFAPIEFFYRNKSIEYYEDIILRNNGIMRKTLKDNNGDMFSVINKNLEGLFFSALLDPKTLQPPNFSVFGTRRLFVYAPLMLNTNSNVYFADFYCYRVYIHYITLVITEPGSEADKFCRGKLLKVNAYDNPFIKLVMDNGDYGVYVTTNVHVELFYTESIDLHTINFKQGGFMFEDVPIRGRGASRPDGIPKNTGCKLCNL